MKRFLLLLLAVLFSITCLFSVAVSAMELNANTSRELEQVVSENESFIQNNFINLFEQQLSDPHVEKEVELISANSNYGEVETLNAISCVIQNEQLLSASDNMPALSVLTKVTAISPVNSRRSGDQGNGNYDPSQVVYLYTRLYYVTSSSNGYTTYKMTKVEGNYAIHRSGIGVTSQYVWYGQNSNIIPNNESGSLYPSGSSWSKNTGFSNYCYGAGYGIMGVNYQVGIINYNNGSTWSYTLYNTKWI